VTLAGASYTLLILAVAANLGSVAYVLAAILEVGRFQRLYRAADRFRPPVTILKPLCGLEAGLYENLRSFCVQDYPEYQVIFGVRDAADPAATVVQRLIGELPRVDISFVVDGTVTGPNLKVSNLGNMYRAAKHPYLIVADSDMRVDEHYVASVVAPLEDRQVGTVTCLYSAEPAGGLPSLLASMLINGWFLPSVLASAALGKLRFALGATIALRRELLDRIGGFAALSHRLADDQMLGRLVSDFGYRVVLSGYVVENVVHEPSLAAFFRHELRWARTIRIAEPLGYAFSFLMYGVPLSMIGAVLLEAALGWGLAGLAAIALAIVLRLWMHAAVCRKLGLAKGGRALWLVPLCDMLRFLVWAASYFGRDIDWKDRRFTVSTKGLMQVTKGSEA